MKLTIYLAGPGKDKKYRKEVIDKYGKYAVFIDPMNITFDEVFENIGEDLSDIFIIRRDKKMIEQCDILVAKVEHLPKKQIMIGTLMEIVYAHTRGIPVFTISSDNTLLQNPWIKFHSNGLFNSIDECFGYIFKHKIDE